MPPQQPQYPGQPWGQQPQPNPPQQTRPWYKKKRFVIPLGTLAFLVILGLILPTPDEPVTVADPPAASQPAAAAVPSKAEKKQPAAKPVKTTPPPKPVLTQEERFIALIENARDEADRADNDFRKRLALTKRDKAICKFLDSKKVENWTGEVTNLDTNGDGLGVLEIEIADDVKVSTWNNALSDFEDNTLIKTSSPIFEAMSSMNEGDQVRFSGSFTRDSESCIGEQSLTDTGSTETPTFTMKFSKLN